MLHTIAVELLVAVMLVHLCTVRKVIELGIARPMRKGRAVSGNLD